jgi:hypothetical protein
MSKATARSALRNFWTGCHQGRAAVDTIWRLVSLCPFRL